VLVLLSYGFCLEDNPCDSFAMKLAPPSSELLKVVLDATSQEDLSVPAEAEESIHTLPISSHQSTSTLPRISPMTPHNRPPAHNLAHNIYYIRSSSRHHLDEDGYANPAHHSSLAAPMIPALRSALLGFPAHLLVTLGISLATPHEQQIISINPTAYGLEHGCERLGIRNCIAVANLLLQRLQMELERLDGAESAFQASNDDDDERSDVEAPTKKCRQMRRQCVNIYRTGQRKILQENSAVLETGLASCFASISALLEPQPPVVQGTDYGTLLTLGAAFDVLKLLNSKQHNTVLSGLAATYGLSYTPTEPRKLLTQFREMGVEEVAWAVWICTVVKLRGRHDTEAMVANGAQDTAMDHWLWRWCSWLEVAYGLGADRHAAVGLERPDADGFIQHLLEVVQNMQASSESLDDEAPWSSSFIAACGAIVQAESMVMRMKSGTALSQKIGMRGNGQEQVEEYSAISSQEGRDAEMTETVVLYVGPGLEVSR